MTPLRWSNLRWMGKSPAHFKYYLDNPLQPTPAMRFGTLVHGLVFKPCFEPVIWGRERRGKDWADFKERNSGVEIFTEKEYDEARRVVDSLYNSCARNLLDCGVQEHRISWELAGIPCSGTPDVYDDEIVVDLKVTNDSSAAKLPWHAKRMGWLGQMAWYAQGLALYDGTERTRLYIVAVESKPPYNVVGYHLTPTAVEMGERTWRSYFEQYQLCMQTGQWPGYAETIQPLDALDEALELTLNGEEIEL